MKTIALDVDDVVANLISTWVQRYNDEWGDTLDMNSITEWDMTKFVLKKCNSHIYDYIEDPDIYNDVYPIPLAPMGIKNLRDLGYRIIFVTSSTEGHQGRKLRWLKDHCLIDSNKNYVETQDKSIIKTDFMIDDRYENVRDFSGCAILFNRPWNKNKNWTPRVDNWYQIIELMKEFSDV